MPPDTEDFYSGLRTLLESAFPKRCPTCGRIYATTAEFLRETTVVRSAGSGLRQSQDEDNQPIVELFRNCFCGSTLMDVYGDRRDTGAQGHHRRELFQRLLQQLERRGIGHDQARRELLKIVHGERSLLVEQIRRLSSRESG